MDDLDDETPTPRDTEVRSAPQLAEMDRVMGGDGVPARQDQAEQLRQRHTSTDERQQLNLEQLEQLKAFKNQLVHELLTHLSPARGSHENSVGIPAQRPPSFQGQLSLEEAGQLIYPLSPLPPHHSRAGVPTLTPTRPSTTVAPTAPPPLPNLAPTTHPHTYTFPDTGHCNTPTNQQQTPPNQPLLDHSPSPAPSPDAAVVSPEVPKPLFSHSPPRPSHESPAHSTLLAETDTDSYNTPSHNLIPSYSQSIPLLSNLALMPSNEYHNSSQHMTSYCNSTATISPLSTTATHTLRSSQGANAVNTPSAVKAALIEKHARYVEDLKRYYESQLAELRASLQAELKPPTRTPTPVKSPPLERGFQSPVLRPLAQYGGAVRSPDTQLRNELEQLKTKCVGLESKLQQSNIVNQALEAQMVKQQNYWLEWQSQAETASQTIAVLQDRLDASRTQLKQQDSIAEQLQADLQVSVGEIQFWKEQRTQETDKFKQLYVEFEELQRQNESLEATVRSLREELSTARKEMGRLDAAVKTSSIQEHTLKSTIHKLEDRQRHLEHVNNRLHSQATHYTLGSPLNTPDDDKLNRRSRTPSPPPSHLPLNHRMSPLTAPPPPPQHPITTSPVGSKSAPLSRQKWLQPSDPGLILGTPLPPTPPPSSHPPTRHAHSNTMTTSSETTSSPLLQSTGQTIVRQLSDSSNEGEDPTSLTRQSYINDRSRAGNENSLLVSSTLSAIHRGKIRTDDRPLTKQRQQKESVDERLKRSLREVAEAEEKLAELRREKENLESALQRMPSHGGRVTRQSKQTKLETEKRLDEVIREIGSVRMILRNHHALRK